MIAPLTPDEAELLKQFSLMSEDSQSLVRDVIASLLRADTRRANQQPAAH